MQGLYALDAADGTVDSVLKVSSQYSAMYEPDTYDFQVANLLIQALLQAPNYERWNEYVSIAQAHEFLMGFCALQMGSRTVPLLPVSVFRSLIYHDG